MVGLLANRAMAWLVLGGGGLVVIAMLYTGAVRKGSRGEAAQWETAVQAKTEADRRMNFQLNQGTLATDADLRRQEEEIVRRWQKGATAPEGGAK